MLLLILGIINESKEHHPHRWWSLQVCHRYRSIGWLQHLGCAQLENLDMFITSKRQLALEYAEYFKNVENIHFFTEPEDTFSNDNGVMTCPIWELMNRLPMFEHCENDGLKNTIWFADRVVNIPSSVRLGDL